MATSMTADEIEEALENSEQLEEHGYRHPEDEDDWYMVVLRKTAAGRHFRLVESSGYNSQFGAAGNIGEWLEESEIDDWKDVSSM